MARYEEVWKSVQVVAAGGTVFTPETTSQTIVEKTKPNTKATGTPVDAAGAGAGGASGTTSPNTKTPSSAGQSTAAAKTADGAGAAAAGAGAAAAMAVEEAPSNPTKQPDAATKDIQFQMLLRQMQKDNPEFADLDLGPIKVKSNTDGMSTYIDVLSNDMLKHKSLPSSPETLCGKIVADTFRPSAIDEMCDICMTLGDGFVNEAKVAAANPDCKKCRGTGRMSENAAPNSCICTLGSRDEEPNLPTPPDGAFKTARFECGTCGHGDDRHNAEKAGSCDCCRDRNPKKAQAMPQRDFSQAELNGDPDDDDEFEDDEDYDYEPSFDGDEDEDDDTSWGLDEDDYELPDGDDAGTFINEDDDDMEASEGGYFGLGDDDASLTNSVVDFFRENPHELEEFLNYVTEKEGHKSAAAAKVALNYTLDGQKIVDGFKVMLTSQEANSLPYLDTNKITISEKVTCSDCREPSWLQTVASCRDCNEFKCSSCMESMRDFSGVCRRCANTLGDTIGDETPYSERDLYFEYFLNSETESPLFLPEGE